MANRRFNKQTTQPLKNGGRAKAMGGGMMRRDMRSGYYPSDMGMEGGAMYKKGGRIVKGKKTAVKKGAAKRGFGRAFKGGRK